MKKIILSAVFVFASFAMVNASANRINCIQLAFDVDASVSGGISYATFQAIVEKCELQQQ